ELALHNTALAIPDSPPLRFERMRVMVDHGHVWLAPAVARTAQQDEFRLEANYSMADDSLDLSITTDDMKVESLRAQAALAGVAGGGVAVRSDERSLERPVALSSRSRRSALDGKYRTDRHRSGSARRGRSPGDYKRPRGNRWRPRGNRSDLRACGETRVHWNL